MFQVMGEEILIVVDYKLSAKRYLERCEGLVVDEKIGGNIQAFASSAVFPSPLRLIRYEWTLLHDDVHSHASSAIIDKIRKEEGWIPANLFHILAFYQHPFGKGRRVAALGAMAMLRVSHFNAKRSKIGKRVLYLTEGGPTKLMLANWSAPWPPGTHFLVVRPCT